MFFCRKKEASPSRFSIVRAIASFIFRLYFAYISLALGFKNIRRMLNAKCPEDIADLDGDTAKLVMIFSLILAIANFVSPFVVR